MAMNNNRNYIGIEISEEYCDIIESRLSPLKTFIEKSDTL
jgi:DNA modification methylase